MNDYSQRDTIFEFDYFIPLVRSVGCFLFSLLSMRILLASAASWFRSVAVFSLYFSAYLSISSLTVDIEKDSDVYRHTVTILTLKRICNLAEKIEEQRRLITHVCNTRNV